MGKVVSALARSAPTAESELGVGPQAERLGQPSRETMYFSRAPSLDRQPASQAARASSTTSAIISPRFRVGAQPMALLILERSGIRRCISSNPCS